MKYPKEVRTHCPFCRKHTTHKVKGASKGRARSMAFGNRKHKRRLKGFGGKRAGEKTVKKQGKKQVITLTCSVCSKKHNRTIGGRTTKKIEFA
ncbi:MAG: 50S ribosomal protein L44e [Candidatus ainarchaeum sp.]|nr:50S ribosomal protein L44e [Candidatus ainarchaeum sp.]